MTHQSDPSRDSAGKAAPDGDAARKPYQAPDWEVEEVFANTFLGCAKEDDMTCGAGPIQS